jgi:hypothetical protein
VGHVPIPDTTRVSRAALPCAARFPSLALAQFGLPDDSQHLRRLAPAAIATILSANAATRLVWQRWRANRRDTIGPWTDGSQAHHQPVVSRWLHPA